ncbi:hypothetical protein DM02DRAFT_369649 [Periconia macrospinosa]|uniref:Uncharacterized protein n=1 Tax=Periconia macrospinosa TaxID=97972 RepID=A0A2V1CZB3_9PLEO|nr:hypothetical protein DM02DRAFT_369649 [Periconia macrospinosa]
MEAVRAQTTSWPLSRAHRPSLFNKLLKWASMHMLDEQGPGLYAPNTLTSLLAQP